MSIAVQHVSPALAVAASGSAPGLPSPATAGRSPPWTVRIHDGHQGEAA